MGMILTGRHVPAHEGVELGFVNEVVATGQALAGAERWAKTILQNGPMSIPRLEAGPCIVASACHWNRPSRNSSIYPAVRALAASEDYVEGPKAFAEKRAPQ